MSPVAALHSQLASIMESLANTAVAEICDLVDSGYSVLQLEVSRGRKENEVLRRKLRLMELRAAARSSAMRSTVPSYGPTLTLYNGRVRTQLPPQHRAASRMLNQETLPFRNSNPSLTSVQDTTPERPAACASVELTAVIKVEDEDESWSQHEHNNCCHAVDGQSSGTEAPPPMTKQEVSDDGSQWVSGEVSSTSVCITDSSGYDSLLYQRSLPTQNALQVQEDPSCSYTLAPSENVSVDSNINRFTFTETETDQQQPEGFHSNHQGAPLPSEETQPQASQQQQPRIPVRKQTTQKQAVSFRRLRAQPNDDNNNNSTDSGLNKSFVCTYCGKTLACLKNLKTHMRVHTGEKPFVCSLCGKKFSDSSNLKRHQSVHTGEKRYCCVHCGKRFAQSGSLKAHMSVHTDCKQFRCSYCEKTFISASHLRRHVTMHAAEKQFPTTYQ